jgi:hypothetical protein
MNEEIALKEAGGQKRSANPFYEAKSRGIKPRDFIGNPGIRRKFIPCRI